LGLNRKSLWNPIQMGTKEEKKVGSGEKQPIKKNEMREREVLLTKDTGGRGSGRGAKTRGLCKQATSNEILH